MFTLSTPFAVKRHSDTEWRLIAPLVYKGKRDTFTIPAGYVTDFASVPRMLQWFAPSTGKYTLAAVLHDYLCDALDDTGVASIPVAARPGWNTHTTSRDVDGLFRRVMREQKVPAVLRWFMWAGVRWGALFNRRRRPGIVRDMPLVLLLSLVALPLIAPAAVCIGVAYFIQFVLEGCIGFVTKPFTWK